MTIYVHIHKVTHDAPRKAAGVVFLSDCGHVLLLKRSADSSFGGFWGLPAGGIEPGESPKRAAMREVAEEIAYDLNSPERVKKVWESETFTCFAACCPAFSPRLNREHTTYMWARPDELPTPLHPNIKEQIEAALRSAVTT